MGGSGFPRLAMQRFGVEQEPIEIKQAGLGQRLQSRLVLSAVHVGCCNQLQVAQKPPIAASAEMDIRSAPSWPLRLRRPLFAKFVGDLQFRQQSQAPLATLGNDSTSILGSSG